jgi:hypothetical protein
MKKKNLIRGIAILGALAIIMGALLPFLSAF